MKSRQFGIGALLAGLIIAGGCSSSKEATVSTPPQSAQYHMSIDWTYPLDPNPPKALGPNPLELGSVVSVQGVTYATSQRGTVIAIDEKTAQPKWKTQFDLPVTAGPVVTSKAIFVALNDGTIVRLSKANGSEIWRYDTGAAVENALTATKEFVACTNANNRVFVLDAETGALKWRRERPRSQEFAMYGQAAPIIHNDMVYAGFSDGYIVGYALVNGTAVWSRELAPNSRFKDLDTSPVIVDNTMYVASSSGGLYALALDDGHTIWHREIFGISSIVPFQNNIYLSSQSGIIRLRRSDGQTYWVNTVQDGALISPLQVGKSSIYATVQRLGLVVLDRREGTTQYIVETGSDFTSAPFLTDGALTLMSNRSTIYRMRIQDTPLIK